MAAEGLHITREYSCHSAAMSTVASIRMAGGTEGVRCGRGGHQREGFRSNRSQPQNPHTLSRHPFPCKSKLLRHSVPLCPP